MISKIAIISACVAFIALIGFIAKLTLINHNQGQEIARLKAELKEASILLETQNAQILMDKLEIESYKNKSKEIKERVITRYVNTSTQDKECEAQLNAIQKALNVFYTRDKQ